MTVASALAFILIPYSFHANPHRHGVAITAPAKHHFNLDAPMKATVTAKSTGKDIQFEVIEKTKPRILFEAEAMAISPEDEVRVEAYLCDDAKTYCVKKMLTARMGQGTKTEAEIKKSVKKTQGAPVETTHKIATLKKDEHGFWDNAPNAAIAEAKETKKPLLIDFYGIWCPPCNLFNELVFPKKAFKDAAKNFVLLKMDADLESSWELKSKFKITGYPTLVFADAELNELNRVIGFMSLKDLTEKMTQVMVAGNTSLKERVQSAKGKPSYSTFLIHGVIDSLTRDDTQQALEFTEEGLKEFPGIADFKIFELKLKNEKVSEKVAELHQGLKSIGTPALVLLAELEGKEVEQKKDLKLPALATLDELKSRINPKTLQLDNLEPTLADLESMRVDVAEAAGDEPLKMQAMTAAAQAYKKLIQLYGKKDSRGLNIELAYCLRKTGKLAEAKEIYSRFIKKYPKEFTFYLHFAKFYQEQKDLKNARAMVDQAVKYAYGDNKIRSIEAQAKIMDEQGQTGDAIKAIDEFLTSFKAPDDSLKVRTKRHLNALKDLRDKFEKSQKDKKGTSS